MAPFGHFLTQYLGTWHTLKNNSHVQAFSRLDAPKLNTTNALSTIHSEISLSPADSLQPSFNISNADESNILQAQYGDLEPRGASWTLRKIFLFVAICAGLTASLITLLSALCKKNKDTGKSQLCERKRINPRGEVEDDYEGLAFGSWMVKEEMSEADADAVLAQLDKALPKNVKNPLVALPAAQRDPLFKAVKKHVSIQAIQHANKTYVLGQLKKGHKSFQGLRKKSEKIVCKDENRSKDVDMFCEHGRVSIAADSLAVAAIQLYMQEPVFWKERNTTLVPFVALSKRTHAKLWLARSGDILGKLKGFFGERAS